MGASLPSSAAYDVGVDASSWGTEVEGSRAEGHSTFVRDFGRGNLVITSVSWAR